LGHLSNHLRSEAIRKVSNQRRFALIGRGFGSDDFNDAVGGLFVDSSEINFTYDGTVPSITAALINASIVYARLQNASAVSVLGRSANSSGVLADIAASANDRVLARTSDSVAFQQLTVGMAPDAVWTFAKLQNADAVSVLGRSANSSGVMDEIAAGANDRILRRVSNALDFGQLTAGMFPNTVVPDAALSTNVPLLNGTQSFTALNTFTKSYATAGAALKFSSTSPGFVFEETGVTANNQKYAFYVDGEALRFDLTNDAESAFATWLILQRTANVADSITMTATTFTHSGDVLALTSGTGNTTFNMTPTGADSWALITNLLNTSDFVIYNNTDGAAGLQLKGDRTLRLPAYGAGMLTTDSSGNVSASGFASGTYTPTLTNVANLDASTAYVCQYFRVGNTVTVSGKVDVDPTTITTSTTLGISLPIASDFANAEDCGGVAAAPAFVEGIAILADTTNNRASMTWIAQSTVNGARYFTFTYEVL
jgi:hypothetical protein